jgi:hypothetical protein
MLSDETCGVERLLIRRSDLSERLDSTVQTDDEVVHQSCVNRTKFGMERVITRINSRQSDTHAI